MLGEKAWVRLVSLPSGPALQMAADASSCHLSRAVQLLTEGTLGRVAPKPVEVTG